MVACATLVGVVHLLGSRSVVVRSARSARLWLVALLALWLVMLALTPDATYLAFPWFFVLLHRLPRPAGLAAVAFTTAAAIGGFAWHQGDLTAAMVIGPVLGAVVVIGTVLGYHALQAESEQRRRLLVELSRTRDELAATERRAGVHEERERLSREIHDTLAQGLSSIQLLLQAAGRSLDPDRGVDAARAAGLVEQARVTAQDNLAEARRVVRALAPGDLQETTLSAALERLCSSTAAQTGVQVTYHHEGPVIPLPTAVEVALLRIAQSALGNMAQHSRATRADVTLTVMDTEVTLDVVDDGVGFEPASAAVEAVGPTDRGFGLRSMRSRTAELGGSLIVESRPGEGTAVSVHLGRVASIDTSPSGGSSDAAGGRR